MPKRLCNSPITDSKTTLPSNTFPRETIYLRIYSALLISRGFNKTTKDEATN